MDLTQERNSIVEKRDVDVIDAKSDMSSQTSDQYLCSRCEQSIPSVGKHEHNDWHFAKDLQEEDHNDVTVSLLISKDTTHVQQQDVKQASDSKNARPPSYAPPPGPAPTTSAYRITRTQRHRNQVIEAANVRARDEQQMQNAL